MQKLLRGSHLRKFSGQKKINKKKVTLILKNLYKNLKKNDKTLF